MPTVITDKSDLKSIEDIWSQFKEEEQANIYSSKMTPLEKAIVLNDLKISNIIIQRENKNILFILNNGAILQRDLDHFEGLTNAGDQALHNFENMEDGVLWPEIPQADISLKNLLQEELQQKYKLEIA